jgi:hypothetical protein
MLFAGVISALPAAILFTTKEISLFKLLLFPLVWRCIVSKAIERGYFP